MADRLSPLIVMNRPDRRLNWHLHQGFMLYSRRLGVRPTFYGPQLMHIPEGFHYRFNRRLNLKEVVKRTQTNAIIIYRAGHLDMRWLFADQLKNAGVPVILLDCDFCWIENPLTDISVHADLHLVRSPGDLHRSANPHVGLCPFSVDPSLFADLPTGDREGICYAGHPESKRGQYDVRFRAMQILRKVKRHALAELPDIIRFYSQHLAALTCGGSRHTLTAKHFEIPAAGCILFTDGRNGVKHFVPDDAFVVYRPDCGDLARLWHRVEEGADAYRRAAERARTYVLRTANHGRRWKELISQINSHCSTHFAGGNLRAASALDVRDSAAAETLRNAPVLQAPHQKSNHGTHLPMLAAALAYTHGRILELGCGHFSTPYLHFGAPDREIVSCETDREWLATFKHLQSADHRFVHVADWAQCQELDGEYDVALIDCSPPAARAACLRRLADRARLIVVHDSLPDYGCEELLRMFRWRLDYDRYQPRTTVVSNRQPIPWKLGYLTVAPKTAPRRRHPRTIRPPPEPAWKAHVPPQKVQKIRAAVLCSGPSLERYAGRNGYGLRFAVNRAAGRWRADYWVALDSHTFAQCKAIGHPQIVTSHEVWVRICKRYPEMRKRVCLPKGEIRTDIPGQDRYLIFTSLTAVLTAYMLGARQIDIYGADLHGRADFDGFTSPKQSRTPERWAKEARLLSQLTSELTARGVTLRRVLAEN